MNSIIYHEEVDGPDFQLSVINKGEDDFTLDFVLNLNVYVNVWHL